MYTELRFQRDGKAEVFTFDPQDYLRREGSDVHGPADFDWSQRQLSDLTALFQGVDADGARQRIARDLGTFLASLGWQPDEDALEAADDRGEEYVFTVTSDAPELYTLPWEVTRTSAGDVFLADHPSVLVRHAIPGLAARDQSGPPTHPGVLFCWSDAAGRVPNGPIGAILEAACEGAGVAYEEAPRFHGGTLQDILDETPFSVLHLLCHGLPPDKPGEPALLGWGDGSQKPVTAVRLAKILRPYRKHLRMVVLSACGSGDASQDALFLGSVAQELHKKGIPTVISSRYLLSIPGAIRMVRVLYDKLLHDGWSVERSVRATRMRLFRADSEGETHEGDAYGIQVYTHTTERVETAEGTAERPVVATYPFGSPDKPAPGTEAPRQAITLVPADTAEGRAAQKEALLAALRELGEDPSLALYEDASKAPGVVPAPRGMDGGDGGISEATASEAPATTPEAQKAEVDRIKAQRAWQAAEKEAAAAARHADAAEERARASGDEADQRAAAEARRDAKAANATEADARAAYEDARLYEQTLKSTQRPSGSEDDGAIVVWTTVDGAQRLLAAQEDGRMKKRLGFGVLALQVITPFIPTPALAAPAAAVLIGAAAGTAVGTAITEAAGAAASAASGSAAVGGGTALSGAAAAGGGTALAGTAAAGGISLGAKIGGVVIATAATVGVGSQVIPPLLEESPTPIEQSIAVDVDGDGYSPPDDCDDTDSEVNPGATEIPGNDKNDDCDPTTADVVAAEVPTDADHDGYSPPEDCDDGDAHVHPGRNEVVGNDKDDDCDPATLDDPDSDGDGVPDSTDCKPDDPEVFPGHDEVPDNGKDDDCNPDTPDLVNGTDADGDGFGSVHDCADDDPAINPGRAEILGNEIDDDCDPSNDNPDQDGDGFAYLDDCDDLDSSVRPGAEEIPANDIDEDCDGVAAPAPDWTCMFGNASYSFVIPSSAAVWPREAAEGTVCATYACPGTPTCEVGLVQGPDADGDGVPADGGDCADDNPDIHAAKVEIEGNGLDDDCDPATPDVPTQVYTCHPSDMAPSEGGITAESTSSQQAREVACDYLIAHDPALLESDVRAECIAGFTCVPGVVAANADGDRIVGALDCDDTDPSVPVPNVDGCPEPPPPEAFPFTCFVVLDGGIETESILVLEASDPADAMLTFCEEAAGGDPACEAHAECVEGDQTAELQQAAAPPTLTFTCVTDSNVDPLGAMGIPGTDPEDARQTWCAQMTDGDPACLAATECREGEHPEMLEAPDIDGDFVPDAEDCAPMDPSIKPGNTEETWNNKDDDCDPSTPDLTLSVRWRNDTNETLYVNVIEGPNGKFDQPGVRTRYELAPGATSDGYRRYPGDRIVFGRVAGENLTVEDVIKEVTLPSDKDLGRMVIAAP